MREHKREYRNLNEETKKKISSALKGRRKSDAVRRRISQGLKNYWQGVPYKEGDE